jgi:hypothetical protein
VVIPAPTGALRRSPATGHESDVRTLADEHALLLRGVHRRGASVLALAAARTWPYAELGTLTEFPRTAVLPQSCDEEELLYPNVSALFAELGAVPSPSGHLENHMSEERAVLGAPSDALDDVPCVTDPIAGGPPRSTDEPASILIDAPPAVPTAQARTQRMSSGGSVSARRSTRAPVGSGLRIGELWDRPHAVIGLTQRAQRVIRHRAT